jgi:hypothetical protein
MIASGTLSPYMRPFYVALKEYGAYAIDTSGRPGQTFKTFDYGAGGPHIEDAGPWVKNGATNPWIPWFQAQGASRGRTWSGHPMWHFDNNFFRPIAPYLKALSPCYASGTCSDSIQPGQPTTQTPARPAPPRNLRVVS